MQDKIILGLLLEGDKSSYELVKFMERSTGFFYNTSQGSIQPAIRKLLAEGLIQVNQRDAGKRRKIVYGITSAGKEAFDRWVNEPIPLGKPREASMIRMFFFHYVRKDHLPNILEQYMADIRDTMQLLQGVDRMIKEQMRDRGVSLTGNLKFQLDTLRLGSDYYRFLLKWYERYLEEINKT